MKTNQNALIVGLLVGLVFWGLIAFVVIKANPEPAKPTYTQSDSLRMVAIDSVKGEYQQVIDSILRVKPKIITRVKWLKGADSIIYVGQDSSCVEIIERKNALICGQDSLINMLDTEARLYSDLVLLERDKNKLEIKRNLALSDSIGSLHVLYRDSLTEQRKTIKKEQRSTLFYKVTTTVAAALGIYGIVR